MEENNQTKQSTSLRKHISLIWLVAGAIALLAIGFFGAMQYLKNNNPQSAASSGSPSGRQMLATGGGDGSSGSGACGGQPALQLNIGGQAVQACGRPTMGKATSVSATSITVQPDSGSAQTFSITDSTKISEHGNAASPTSITSGTSLVVIPGSSDPAQAGYILINPNLQAPSGQ